MGLNESILPQGNLAPFVGAINKEHDGENHRRGNQGQGEIGIPLMLNTGIRRPNRHACNYEGLNIEDAEHALDIFHNSAPCISDVFLLSAQK